MELIKIPNLSVYLFIDGILSCFRLLVNDTETFLYW